MNSFDTITSAVTHEIKIKGSRFIGYAAPVQTKEEAEAILESIRKTHFSATHHCYAYRLNPDGLEFRFNDDGEPSGTAGRPILDAIESRGLFRVMCVVIRYFGGTKLGTGGLARAYQQSAAETLDLGERIQRRLYRKARLLFGYEWTGAIMSLLDKHTCRVIESRYDSDTELHVLIPEKTAAAFETQCTDATQGKVRTQWEGNCYD